MTCQLSCVAPFPEAARQKPDLQIEEGCRQKGAFVQREQAHRPHTNHIHDLHISRWPPLLEMAGGIKRSEDRKDPSLRNPRKVESKASPICAQNIQYTDTNKSAKEAICLTPYAAEYVDIDKVSCRCHEKICFALR